MKYNGGPLWKNNYSWQNVYWGPYFVQTTASAWVARLEKATLDIESDKSYSGGLSQCNVGIGRVIPFTTIKTAPPAKLSDDQIKQALTTWISQGSVSKFGARGGYNIFSPPGDNGVPVTSRTVLQCLLRLPQHRGRTKRALLHSRALPLFPRMQPVHQRPL